MVTGTLSDSADLQREMFTRGGMGERLHTFETVASGIACRVILAGNQKSEQLSQDGAQDNVVERYRVILAYSQTVEAGDRLVIDGATYEVQQITEALSQDGFVSVIAARYAA